MLAEKGADMEIENIHGETPYGMLGCSAYETNKFEKNTKIMELRRLYTVYIHVYRCT